MKMVQDPIGIRIITLVFHSSAAVPDWFPVSRLKREVKRTRDLSEELTDIHYWHVEEYTVSSFPFGVPQSSVGFILSFNRRHLQRVVRTKG